MMSDFTAESVWAKSDGKSLIKHLEDCLTVYRQVVKALPMIPHLVKQEDFFDLLFCAVYMHDWGKTHFEFQKVLKKKNNQWGHNRHEIFSVPFVGMLKFPPEYKELIAQAIIGHHKDFETLLEYVYSDDYIKSYSLNSASDINPLDFKKNLVNKLDATYLKGLKNRLQKFYNKHACGKRKFEFDNIVFPSVKNPIKEFVWPYIKENSNPVGTKYWQQMLMSGCVKLCDHMGSAEISEIPRLKESNFNFLDSFSEKLYKHQSESSCIEGNVLLSAPTGSGKTEAALLWLKKQFQSGRQGRIFYVLPYTASINAMHRRLIENFEKKGTKPGKTRYIGILHGKLSQYLAEYFENSNKNSLEKKSSIAKLKDMHRQMIHPIKVVTPFQILKYCYGVKGFEKGFAELAGAMLIFDEIHAYDTQTFAQITASLNWMTRHLNISTMIMTATLPSFMLKELSVAIGSFQIIKADDGLLDRFGRHRVNICEGNIFDQIPAILKAAREGMRIIVVCNTVLNAQEIFKKLLDDIDGKKSVLLHSRFTANDRLEKEKILFGKEKNINLLVGTQAIEVSLNIDFDIMFTEPAPLDALIQRFGRINRQRKKGICPVYVCRKGGENDYYIYPKEIVNNTMNVLHDTSVIKENKLQQMLDTVYPDFPEKDKYYKTKTGFLKSLSRLRPFMRHKEEEKEFYKRFTGVSVVPVQFQEKYEELIHQLDFIEAEKLVVTIHQGMFFKLCSKGVIEKSEGVFETSGRLKKFPFWIARCQYSKNLGLLEQKPAKSCGLLLI